MTEKKIYSTDVKDALEVVTEKGKGTRAQLIEEIGLEMYNKLCTLGYITQGATIDPEKKERIRVWKLTDKPNLFNEIERAPTLHEEQVGKALAGIFI